MSWTQIALMASLVAAGIHLALILFLAAKGRATALTDRTLIGFLGASALWLALYALWQPAYYPPNMALVALMFMAFMLIIATASYIGWRTPRWLQVAGIAPVLVLTSEFVFPEPINSADSIFQFILTIGAIAAIASWGLFSLSAIRHSWRAYRSSHLAWHANRMLYWAIALATLFIGQAALLFDQPWLAISGCLLQILGSVELTYAILTHRIFDVRYRLWRTLRLALVGAAAGGVTYLLALLILAQEAPRELTAIMLAGVVAGIGLLIQSVRRWGRRFWGRFLPNSQPSNPKLLRYYSQNIGRALDVEQLSVTVVGAFADLLGVERGALNLLTPGEEGATIETIPGVGRVSSGTALLPQPSLFLTSVVEQAQPLLQYELDFNPEFEGLTEAERSWLQAQEMELFVPILSGDNLEALVGLGPKQSGLTFRPAELDLMQQLADQTGVALQNARLYHEIGAQNAEIRRLIDNLTWQNERLEALDQVKSDFIAIASHELRTPLTQVMGYADILESMQSAGSYDPQQARKMIDQINAASEQLEQVISAMLDASQLDVNALELDLSPQNLGILVRAAAAVYDEALQTRQITLSVEDLNQLPPILADSHRMSQALSNLIGNAIKFTPDGGKIDIAGKVVPDIENNPFVELIVSDSGIGIDPKYHNLIFEKFFRIGDLQLHSTGDAKFKGAGPGLGLHIVRGVVEGHGGRVWVESPGVDEEKLPGSAFHLILPAIVEPQPSVTASLPAQTAQES